MRTEGIFSPGEFYRSLFGVSGSIQGQHEITTSRYRADKLGDRGQSVHAMWQLTRMRRALDMVRSMMREPAATPAAAVSASSLGLSPAVSGTPAAMESTEEINGGTTTPSLLTTTPPATGSTARATIGGTYDGSSGSGSFTFEVSQGGTRGVDNLELTVYDPNRNTVGRVAIGVDDPVDRQYTLPNGMVLSLADGKLLQNDTFTVNVVAPEMTAHTTFEAQFEQSSVALSIGGTYDGSNGSGPLTLEVVQGGTRGQEHLGIGVYDAANNQIDAVRINKNDSIDRQYALVNGLSLTLGTGELIEGDRATIELYSSDPVPLQTQQPQFTGSSALLTIGRDYDGADGSGALTFEFAAGGTHGGDHLEITVYDTGNNPLETVLINKNDALAQSYAIANGLSLTVGEGDLLEGATYSVEVEAGGEEIAVNPDNPFNGTGTDGAGFEPHLSVISGSFDINGVTISVREEDTVNTVLDRINQSDAGLTATFDRVSERVMLTGGSAQTITLDNDTSGFLAAVKLENAVATPGDSPTVSDLERPMAEVAQFTGVQSGEINANGVAIAVNVDTDSLADMLERISASDAGVTASYTSSSGLVSITSKKVETALTLNGGGSGFFSAVNIIEGTHEPREEEIQAVGDAVFERAENLMNLVGTYGSDGSDQVFGVRDESEARARMLGSLVGEIADAMNALFDDEALAGTPTAMTERLRNEVRGAVSAAFGAGGPRFDTDLGINLDFHATKEGIFKFSPAHREVLETVLTTSEGEASLNKMFFGSGSDGLLGYLDDAMADAQTCLETEIGSLGHFLDEFV